MGRSYVLLPVVHGVVCAFAGAEGGWPDFDFCDDFVSGSS